MNQSVRKVVKEKLLVGLCLLRIVLVGQNDSCVLSWSENHWLVFLSVGKVPLTKKSRRDNAQKSK